MRSRKNIVFITCFMTLWSFLSSASFAQPKPQLIPESTEFESILTLRGRPDAPVLGNAEFQLSPDRTALHYKLTVNGLEDITMAHLHLGSVGDLSTPAAWLYPPSPPPKVIPGPFSGVLAEGEITARDLIGPFRGAPLSQLIEAMQSEAVFVNIHAKRFAAGEICGQLRCIIR